MTDRDWDIRRLRDLPTRADGAVQALYWQAFRRKLNRLFGPDRRGLALLARVASRDHALVATTAAGEVIGMAGFRDANGGFAAFDPAALQAVYGRRGAAVRAWLFERIADEESGDRLIVDGLAVAPGWRGRGIGTALIHALKDEARHNGQQAVRLDVASNNPRARALYARLGFRVLRHDRHWLLWPMFGITAMTVMLCEV